MADGVSDCFMCNHRGSEGRLQLFRLWLNIASLSGLVGWPAALPAGCDQHQRTVDRIQRAQAQLHAPYCTQLEALCDLHGAGQGWGGQIDRNGR